MNRLKLYLLALTALIVCSAKADEGMWLLQLMQQQHSIDMMKKQGLKLEAQDLYNPHGVSLKDAVGIFGGGCTGEIISPEGSPVQPPPKIPTASFRETPWGLYLSLIHI